MSRFPIRVGRVYDHGSEEGARLLVDRLWPRGVAKADLRLDGWPRDLTPSTQLRKWFHADPSGRWTEFRERYRAELQARPDAVAACIERCEKGPVILLTAARDPEHSQAAVLRDFLDDRLAEARR